MINSLAAGFRTWQPAARLIPNCAVSEIEPSLLAELLREAMKQGKSPYLSVASNSMSPLIRRGDQIRLAPVTAEQLRPGDIIVYEGPANLITHRYWGFLLENGQKQLVTRGDRPQHFDQPVAPASLIGRVNGRRKKQQFLDLAAGKGKWLNNHLANLARFEIRLFAQTPGAPAASHLHLPASGGAFSKSTNNLFGRVIRRILYSWAIILTLTISVISFAANKSEED